MMRFQGTRAVVTGGAHGIGAASCHRFVAEGGEVVVADTDAAAAEQLAEELGSAARSWTIDVSDEHAWSRLRRHLVETGDGALDVLVNNAFTVTVRPAGELAASEWERQIGVDLSAVYHSVYSLLPLLQSARGAVVNVASVHAVLGYPGHPAYAAAKGGVVALTRQLSAEYGMNVRFNSVLPGAIRTRIWDDANEQERDHHAALAAQGRLGKPEEVAAAIALLGSDDASYISGSCLTVDGGLTSSCY